MICHTLNGTVRVNVNTGKVSFYCSENSSDRIILNPFDQAIFTDINAKIQCSKVSTKNYFAWKTGILKFDYTPLKEVCIDLTQYYNKSITVAPNIANLVLTGTFKNEKLENVLKAIELTLNIKGRTTDEGVIIYK